MLHFFLVASWLGICAELALDRKTWIRNLSNYPLPPCLVFFFFLPKILTYTTWQLFEISARLKLFLVPFSSLYFVIC